MKRAIALFLWAFMIFVALSANAALDPARAAGDVDAAAADHRAFCTHPLPTLTDDQSRLCPYSKQIPDCKAYVDACDALTPKTASLPAWLTSALTAIARALGWIIKTLGPVGLWVLAAVVFGIVLYPVIQSLAQCDAKGPRRCRSRFPVCR